MYPVASLSVENAVRRFALPGKSGVRSQQALVFLQYSARGGFTFNCGKSRMVKSSSVCSSFWPSMPRVLEMSRPLLINLLQARFSTCPVRRAVKVPTFTVPLNIVFDDPDQRFQCQFMRLFIQSQAVRAPVP